MRAFTILATASCFLMPSCGSSGVPSMGTGGLPTAPVLAVTAGDSEVTLTWPDVTGATTYTAYWSTDPSVSSSTGNRLQNITSPYVHSGLNNGRVYYYIVYALSSAGLSPESTEELASPTSPYDPSWSRFTPNETISVEHDSTLTDEQNGEALRVAMQNLMAGQRLEIGGGTYSIQSRVDLSLLGTDTEPIWIAAKPGETPIITRPDAAENTINIGSSSATRCLALMGLEITGGDTAIKIYSAEDLWIDNCHIHDCGGVGIAANTMNTMLLYLTRNEIHDTAGSAEGMYLGGNNSSVVMRDSIIAKNHVYDCFGTQGDGIEVKQGSYNNLIAENLVHDTDYPCIIAYGTDGNTVNIIERNVCYNSGDNVMQVQGEAIVRNNLIMAGTVGFHSHDHQGTSTNLTFVHNTIINSGNATNLVSWNGRTGMVFANNVVYSETGTSISFPGGSSGVTITGNVTVGTVSGSTSGFMTGTGLTDFADVTWAATQRDATPTTAGSIFSSGDAVWSEPLDLTGTSRTSSLESGCYDEN